VTKTQWVIISVLGLTAIVVVSCLGCIVLSLFFTSTNRVTSELNATTEPEVVATPPMSTRPTVVLIQVPTPSRSIATRPPDTKQQIKLEVGSYTSYPNTIGGLYVAGEILNKSDAPAWQIQVAVSLLDNGGNVLAAASSGLADLNIAPAGGKYPFLALISKAPSTWKEIKIQVQGEPYTGSAIFPPYLDLKVEGITGNKPQFGGYALSGRITNTGNKTAESVKVVATAYDPNGKVVDVGWTFSKLNQIQAGGNAPFELQFANLKSAPAKYEVYVQGREKR
jgi:hypothetical protein